MRVPKVSKPAFLLNRRDVIRTRDLCVPNAALYQAEPRAEILFSCGKWSEFEVFRLAFSLSKIEFEQYNNK